MRVAVEQREAAAQQRAGPPRIAARVAISRPNTSSDAAIIGSTIGSAMPPAPSSAPVTISATKATGAHRASRTARAASALHTPTATMASR